MSNNVNSSLDPSISLSPTVSEESPSIGNNSTKFPKSAVSSLQNNSNLHAIQPAIGQKCAANTPNNEDEMKCLLNGSNGVEKRMSMTLPPPEDKFNLVYLVFILNGICALMPWNMFITADKYFVHYKLKVASNEEYVINFLSYLGICAQVPNLLFNLINAFVHTRRGFGLRIMISLTVLICMLVATIILALIDSSSWPLAFFIITMITASVCNGAIGVYQNCVYGMAAHFPMRYTNAVVLGSNISGTLTSFISLFSMMIEPDLKIGAIYYFSTALIIVFLAFNSYFILPRCNFYRYYQNLHEENTSDVNKKMALGWQSYFQPYWHTFKLVWVQLWNIFFVFFVTLSIFPALQVDVQPVSSTFIFAGRYFTPITCFIAFNVFAMLGNFLTDYLPQPGPRFLWVPVLLRGLMIPFFVLSNYRPMCRSWPVLIQNDYVYTLMSVFNGFTNGYLSSLIMMYTPRLVDKAHSRFAAMLATFFLIFGIVSGIYNSLLLAHGVEEWGPSTVNATFCSRR